jgi:hypothetical protein
VAQHARDRPELVGRRREGIIVHPVDELPETLTLAVVDLDVRAIVRHDRILPWSPRVAISWLVVSEKPDSADATVKIARWIVVSATCQDQVVEHRHEQAEHHREQDQPPTGGVNGAATIEP